MNNPEEVIERYGDHELIYVDDCKYPDGKIGRMMVIRCIHCNGEAGGGIELLAVMMFQMMKSEGADSHKNCKMKPKPSHLKLVD